MMLCAEWLGLTWHLELLLHLIKVCSEAKPPVFLLLDLFFFYFIWFSLEGVYIDTFRCEFGSLFCVTPTPIPPHCFVIPALFWNYNYDINIGKWNETENLLCNEHSCYEKVKLQYIDHSFYITDCCSYRLLSDVYLTFFLFA